MTVKKELIKRDIAGETFLVPVGKSVYDANGLFCLTEVGAFLWDLLPESWEADELLKAVLDAYDVDESTARADIDVFLEKLKKLDIL